MRSVHLNFDVRLPDDVADYVEAQVADPSFSSLIANILTRLQQGGFVVTNEELDNIIEELFGEDDGETQTLSNADLTAINNVIAEAIQEVFNNQTISVPVPENNEVEQKPVANVVNFGDKLKDRKMIEESNEEDEDVDNGDFDMLADMFNF